jgi:S1-C subfamily serine protease
MREQGAVYLPGAVGPGPIGGEGVSFRVDRRQRLVAACLALACAPAAAETDAARSAEAMAFIRVVGDLRLDYRDARESVVRKNVEVATGSGFVIAPSGLVLTSRHVVETDARRDESGAETTVENPQIQVFVGSGGGGGAWEASVVASDPGSDLAALQVTAADLPYLPLGDSDALEAGRPVRVLGFPFGRQVEVAKRGEPGVIPQVTVTGGSLSAARADEQGETRFLQTDASVQPGNSGGPMLDEDGYVVGVVKMKLARDATSQGAGFSVPVNVVKDFLDANSLLDRLPVVRLRPGVRHSLDWKRIAVELPDGYADRSPSRVLFDAGEMGEVGFRADRWATPWPPAALAEALLGGQAVHGFVPAPATPGRGGTLGRRAAVALAAGKPASLTGSADGTDQAGRRFRVEYAIVDLGKEKIVARYLGPADAVAFNLGLIRRSLDSLEAARVLVDVPVRPPATGTPALVVADFPEGEGQVLAPAGWSREPEAQSACGRLPPPDNGLSASPPQDYTLVLRALRWTTVGPELGRAVNACGQGGGRRAGLSATGQAGYAERFERLGVPIEIRGVLVPRGPETLLLELEAPVAKLPIVEVLYDRWVREVAAGH